MARTRQDIEQVFARLGIEQRTSLPGLSGVSGSSLPKLPGLGGESPLMQSTAAPTPPTGFMQQLGYGLTSPIRMGRTPGTYGCLSRSYQYRRMGW